MKKTTVVNIKTGQYDDYMGRGTLYGNPFIMGVHGGRETVIDLYRTYFYNMMRRNYIFYISVMGLMGHRLGCHCHPLPCHVDIIADFLNSKLRVVNLFRGQYSFLSNFHMFPVLLNGVLYKSAEHAYQALKCIEYADQETIRKAGTPSIAKRLGYQAKQWTNWESTKVSVMLSILRAKFRHPKLRKKLLATDLAFLIEGNTWGDTYWGVCNGVGKNKLGRALMQVRAELGGKKHV